MRYLLLLAVAGCYYTITIKPVPVVVSWGTMQNAAITQDAPDGGTKRRQSSPIRGSSQRWT